MPAVIWWAIAGGLAALGISTARGCSKVMDQVSGETAATVRKMADTAQLVTLAAGAGLVYMLFARRR